MTREEAIYFANCLKNNYTVDLNDLEAFCDMAIKAIEQEPTTKNNLGVDCISRADARKAIIDHQYSDSFCEEHSIDHSINTGMALIALSDLPSVTPQEPFKPMVEIDLDYVIKQKYIEREVLDKIRAEIEPKCDRINSLASVLPYTAHREIQEVLCEILELLQAESEVEDGND